MVDAGEVTTVLRERTVNHPNTTAETDLIEHLLLTERITHHISFDEITQQTLIRVLEKIDGTNYENIDAGGATFPDDFGDATGVTIVLDGAGQDMKITLTSSVAEGASRELKLTARDEIRL